MSHRRRTLRLQDFTDLVEIGRGGFGVVWSAKRKNGEEVAIKKIKREVPEERVRNEIESLSQLSHRFIVEFYEYFIEDGETYLVMELCKLGSLRSYIKEKGPLTEEIAANVLRQLLLVVSYMHDHQVLHRDLSAGNVFIKTIKASGHLAVKLGDFGLATNLKGGQTACTIVGTPGYIANEVFDQDYNQAADVFSLGGVLYTMLTAKDPPRNGRLETNRLSYSADDLIRQMMHPDPKRRPDLKNIPMSSFMRDLAPYSRDTSCDRWAKSGDRGFSRDRQPRSREMRSKERDRYYGERKNGLRDETSRERMRRTDSARSGMRSREESRERMNERQPFRSREESREKYRRSDGPRRDDYSTERRRDEISRKAGRPTVGRSSSQPPGGLQRPLSDRQSSRRNNNPAEPLPNDVPWPLNLYRCGGQRIKSAAGRYIVESDSRARFEVVNAAGKIVRVLLVHIEGKDHQKVSMHRTRNRDEQAKDTGDAFCEIESSSTTYYSGREMSKEANRDYSLLARIVTTIRGKIAKIVQIRPAEFFNGEVHLMENGDLRVKLPDCVLVKAAGKSEVIKMIEGRKEIETSRETLRRIEEVFDRLLKMERFLDDNQEKAYPFVYSMGSEDALSRPGGALASIMPSRAASERRVLTSSTQNSTAASRMTVRSAPADSVAGTLFSEKRRSGALPVRPLMERRENDENIPTPSYKLKKDQGGKGKTIAIQFDDGRLLRQSTANPNQFIFKDSSGKESRFLRKSGSVPKEAAQPLEILLPHLSIQ